MTFAMSEGVQSKQNQTSSSRPPNPMRTQSLDMILNTLESSAAAKSNVGREDRDMPGDGMRQLAAKLKRKLDKTPPRWQVSTRFGINAQECSSPTCAASMNVVASPRLRGAGCSSARICWYDFPSLSFLFPCRESHRVSGPLPQNKTPEFRHLHGD